MFLFSFMIAQGRGSAAVMSKAERRMQKEEIGGNRENMAMLMEYIVPLQKHSREYSETM